MNSKLLFAILTCFAFLFSTQMSMAQVPEKVIEIEEEEPPPPPPEPVRSYPPPPPPPPPPRPQVEEIFTVVEEMPRFPGCEDKSGNERKICAQEKMLNYIYSNLKYPSIARENGVEGTVVIRFYIDKDGSLKDTQILRDIGANCGKEAARVVNSMNQMSEKWIPGKQRGKPVKVYYNLPVKFRLEKPVIKETPQIVEDRMDFDEEIVIEPPSPSIERDAPPPPPPPPPPTYVPEPEPEMEVFRVVEDMPRFPGCEEMTNNQERKNCAEGKMIAYIEAQLQYPQTAKDAGIHGLVVVNFNVDRSGKLVNIKVMRDIGAGCGAEALRIVQSMNEMPEKWIPGKQRGQKVMVNFNLPIRFKLDGDIVPKEMRPENRVAPKLYLRTFTVYPNPTNGIFTVTLKGNKGPTTLSMSNKEGKELFSTPLENFKGEYEKEFNMSKVPKGTYVIKISQFGKEATREITIR